MEPPELSGTSQRFSLRGAIRILGGDDKAKGQVKEKWGKLTDDDLTQINGQREQLEGIIQQRYGLAKDMVRKDVDAWLKNQP